MMQIKMVCEALGGRLPKIDNSAELRQELKRLIGHNFGNESRKLEEIHRTS